MFPSRFATSYQSCPCRNLSINGKSLTGSAGRGTRVVANSASSPSAGARWLASRAVFADFSRKCRKAWPWSGRRHRSPRQDRDQRGLEEEERYAGIVTARVAADRCCMGNSSWGRPASCPSTFSASGDADKSTRLGSR